MFSRVQTPAGGWAQHSREWRPGRAPCYGGAARALPRRAWLRPLGGQWPSGTGAGQGPHAHGQACGRPTLICLGFSNKETCGREGGRRREEDGGGGRGLQGRQPSGRMIQPPSPATRGQAGGEEEGTGQGVRRGCHGRHKLHICSTQPGEGTSKPGSGERTRLHPCPPTGGPSPQAPSFPPAPRPAAWNKDAQQARDRRADTAFSREPQPGSGN